MTKKLEGKIALITGGTERDWTSYGKAFRQREVRMSLSPVAAKRNWTRP